MIVTCEKCDTSFELDDSLIKESGSEVKCSECDHVFTVWKPDAAGEPEPVTESTEAPADSISTEEDLAADIFDAEDLGLEDESEEPVPESEEVGAEAPPEASTETAEEEAEEEFDLGEIEGLEEPAEPGSVEEELDVEGIAEAIEEPTEAGPAEEELDLEGIGEALEEPAEAGPAEEELDLEGIGEPLEESTEAESMEGLDLGDMDEVSVEPVEEEAIDEELDLESISRAVEEAADSPELVTEEVKDEILEFDLIDEEGAPAQQEVSFEEIGVEEDIAPEEVIQEEIEEEIEEEDVAPPVETAPMFEEEKEETGEMEEEEEELEAETPPPAAEDIPAPPSSAMKSGAGKKRISAPIMILLILGLLGGGAYGGYMYLKSTGTSIPFLESLLGPSETTVVEPGNLHITVLEQDIGTRFVENTTAGNLFVIEGKVRNDYPAARNFIMVKGALYATDGTAIRQKNVFCGNVFPDSELQTVDEATIEEKLRNRFGDQRSNFQVPPGKVLPFMVVFSDLPQGFGEYSVQVVSSSAAE